MSLVKKIIIGVILISLLFLIIIDRFTLYLHRRDEHQIDVMYDHIILEADFAIEEASKKINEIRYLHISKEEDRRQLDSIISKMKNEKDISIARKRAIGDFEIKVEHNYRLTDSLTLRYESLENKLKYDKESLKYNLVYKDSTIFNYTYDTSKIEVLLIDTIIIEDDRIIKRIKNKYFN